MSTHPLFSTGLFHLVILNSTSTAYDRKMQHGQSTLQRDGSSLKPSQGTLCNACQEIFRGKSDCGIEPDFHNHYRYHRNIGCLMISAKDGCQLCFLIYSGMESPGFDSVAESEGLIYYYFMRGWLPRLERLERNIASNSIIKCQILTM
jgi:hypothetical protein